MDVFHPHDADPDLVTKEDTTPLGWPSGFISPKPFTDANTVQSQLLQVAETSAPPSAGLDLKTGRETTSISSATLRDPLPLSGLDTKEPIHGGASCDVCGKRDIRGIRYKCVQCANYDRCSTCMTSPSAWAAHDSTHHFFPVQTEEDLVHLAQIVSTQALPQSPGPDLPPTRVAHAGITCDGCAKPMEGVRHKCLVCNDYDFCDVCISDTSKRLIHSPSHTFFAIPTPHYRPLYDDARIRAQPPGVRHDGVVCDMCKSKPLVGVRHRCLDCRDYDLCTECISKPEVRLKHDLKHAFFPIPVPGDFVSYRSALERRKKSLDSHGLGEFLEVAAKTTELMNTLVTGSS